MSGDRTALRWVLGALQVGGAAISLGLLLWIGVRPLSLGAVVLTCVLTAQSVLIFGDRRR